MTKVEFLKECIDYRVRRRELNLWIFFLVFFEVLLLPLLFLDWEKTIGFSILVLVCISPAIIYFALKMRNIKKYFDDYVYYEVVLDKVNNSFFRNRVYFTITINHNQQKIKCDTLSIFSTAIIDFIYYPLDEYMNKNVLVAFNPYLEEVVLVKKVY